MSTGDNLIDIQHTLSRHEVAVNEDAAEIKKLKAAMKLLVELLERLDLYKFQGMEHTTAGEQARDRIREITKELKALF
jgi:hypothetical protein